MDGLLIIMAHHIADAHNADMARRRAERLAATDDDEAHSVSMGNAAGQSSKAHAKRSGTVPLYKFIMPPRPRV
jgi:hypothetical protein